MVQGFTNVMTIKKGINNSCRFCFLLSSIRTKREFAHCIIAKKGIKRKHFRIQKMHIIKEIEKKKKKRIRFHASRLQVHLYLKNI